MGIPFVKMHGLGNDYVYLDAARDPGLEHRLDLPALARAISDRHRGIGSDGLIIVGLPQQPGAADIRMRMFNADGSEAEMCGNGVRCVAKFAHDRLGVRPRPLRVETGRGVLAIDYQVLDGALARATVDMGGPILDLPAVPVDAAHIGPAGDDGSRRLSGRGEPWWFVSMGNPHAVTLLANQPQRPAGPTAPPGHQAQPGVEALVAAIGPSVEVHPAFPRRVNVHAVEVLSRSRARMATWERGAGLTQACGTGACAVLVAGVLAGLLDDEATISLPGGDLEIRWDEPSGHVFMTGPAEDICEGVWPEPASRA